MRSCIFFLFLTACSSADQTPQPQQRPLARVEVTEAGMRRIVDRQPVLAEVEAFERTHLAAGSGGRIDEVLVHEGDNVATGRILMRIAASLAEAQLAQAQAATKAAASRHDRVMTLVAQHLASDAQAEVAETDLRAAQAALKMAQIKLTEAILRAPHGGVVATVHVSAGETAIPGQTVAEIVDIRRVKVVMQVPERDIGFVKRGTPVDVHVDAWPRDLFTGTIETIAVAASKYSRTFAVEVVVDNPLRKLRPGMLGRVELVRQTLENVVSVRRDAVIEDTDEAFVFVIENDAARKRQVSPGPTDGENIAILKGLDPGERVVVVGQRTLSDAEAVEVSRVHGFASASEPIVQNPQAKPANTAK